MGAHRVPISPKGIIGPEGARRKEKFTKWNRANMCTSMHTCLPRRGNNFTKWNRANMFKWVPDRVPICPQGIEVHEV